jgi:hypothetical protein
LPFYYEADSSLSSDRYLGTIIDIHLWDAPILL